jgi:hypothetical protein
VSSLLTLEPPPAKSERMDYLELGANVDSLLELPPLTDQDAAALIRRALPYVSALRALKANTEMMAAEEQRALDAVLAEDEERLRDWIKAKSEDAKSRRCPYGLAGTRNSGGNLVIVDEALALASVREMCPEAIREVVDLSKLPANFTAPGFDVTPTVSKLYVQPLPRGKGAAEGGDE